MDFYCIRNNHTVAIGIGQGKIVRQIYGIACLDGCNLQVTHRELAIRGVRDPVVQDLNSVVKIIPDGEQTVALWQILYENSIMPHTTRNESNGKTINGGAAGGRSHQHAHIIVYSHLDNIYQVIITEIMLATRRIAIYW